ncbi:MFS transporter [Bradyrhizobium valentinum]|uniref:MFS transporter n=1 Tax=Bradyrhizobium valentinum TaxID=1518501 RepID=UPI000A4F85B3|nr:MFS transporter [Bradyrhizobium valentinum]
MLITVAVSASLCSVFTYITPILETLILPHEVTFMLLLFGIGLTVGNFIGGWLGDWKLMPSVVGILEFLIPVLVLFTLTTAALVPAAATVFCWGLLAFSLISPLQMRVVNEAAQAPNLASTRNQGAFNLGNAAGAWVGGLALTHGLAYRELPWIGVALIAVAFTLSLLSHRLDVKASVTGAPEGAR